ncbi:MAG: hypothetical protein ACQESX_06310 [Bacteroidota bacterium]
MKLNGFIGFLIMVTAWGLLSGHDYIPHHHHEYCVSAHEHHDGDQHGMLDVSEEHAHDLSCNFSQVFDKAGKKPMFLSTRNPISEVSLTELKQIIIPYTRKIVPLLFQLHCPMRAPPIIS